MCSRGNAARVGGVNSVVPDCPCDECRSKIKYPSFEPSIWWEDAVEVKDGKRKQEKGQCEDCGVVAAPTEAEKSAEQSGQG